MTFQNDTVRYIFHNEFASPFTGKRSVFRIVTLLQFLTNLSCLEAYMLGDMKLGNPVL